jgi:predicted O-methyltransferase YrrM
MNQQQWTAVDQYITEHLVFSDPALDSALAASTAGGLPTIQVAPNQGKMLHVLAKLIRAKNILELGTLGAYSTIWLARALPADGKLITLEANPTHAKVALTNIERAGLGKIIELREGKALETLPKLEAEKRGPFDLIFIDADKVNIPEYFNWALKLSHPGSLIIVDNVVRDGQVVEAKSTDPNVMGVRRLYEALAKDKRVTCTALQTVGSKGYDGFIMAVVN